MLIADVGRVILLLADDVTIVGWAHTGKVTHAEEAIVVVVVVVGAVERVDATCKSEAKRWSLKKASVTWATISETEGKAVVFWVVEDEERTAVLECL